MQENLRAERLMLFWQRVTGKLEDELSSLNKKKSETMSRILTSEEVSIQNEDLNTKVST